MRAIKKIIALATGATMLGATIMGAMAADLADFPSPLLIKDATFDADIIYGMNADPSDIMGLVDAIAAISVIETTGTVTTGGGVSAVGEAYKVERATNRLNLGEDIVDVATTIDAEDLPLVLADGTYSNDENKDFDYEQTITLSSADFTAFSDKDLNDNDPAIGIHYEDDDDVLRYELSFTTDAESDVDDDTLEDFEDTSIVMLGNTYDIVEATNESGGYLEIMGGAIKDVLEQGQTKTYTISGKDYEVEVTYIGGVTTSEAKFKVNGQTTKALAETDTEKLADGTQLGVREILEEEAGEVTADQVEFYIGAEKMTLENGENLQLNDEDVDDIIVEITGTQSGTEYTLSKIALNWTTEDEFFLIEGESVLMPGLKSVKLSNEGLTQPAEEIIELTNDGADAIALKVPVKGKAAGFDFVVLFDEDNYNGAAINTTGFTVIGEAADKLLLTTAGKGYAWNGSTGDMMVITNNDSDETHFLEVTGYDEDDGADFRDVITGATYLKKEDGDTFEIADMTFTVSNFNKTLKTVNISTTSAYFEGDSVITLEGMKISLPTTAEATYNFTFEEEFDDDDVTGITFGINVEGNQTDDDDAGVDTVSGLTEIHEIGDTDVYVYYELTGEVNTKVEIDKGDSDQYTAKIYNPGGETYGNVYVSETETTFSAAAGGTQAVLKKVTIPLAKSDDDVLAVDSTMTRKNYLLVGGPCANRATARVLGSSTSWPDCADGFTEGVGRILVKEMNGKVSMVVAGMTALDTTRATRVLKSYQSYDLSGDEVEVLGTTATPQTVRAISS